MPKISVIVPIYNVEKYLHRCIDSILVQTFPDFELILVDDGSLDNCGIICDEYANKDSRIRVIHKENGGLSDARNVGIDWAFANSDSEWITFIDSDDWVHPEFFKALLSSAIKYNLQIASLFLTPVKTIADTSKYVQCDFISSIEKMEDVYISFGKEVACYSPGRLYKKELWKDVRFPVGKLFEDVATTYKVLVKVDQIALVHENLYYYFYNNESLSRKKWTSKNLDELEAYEIQLKDKRINSLIKLRLGEQYIDRIYAQIIRVSQLKKNCLRSTVIKQLKKKFKRALLLYSKGTKHDFHNCKYYYEIAFPKEMKIYWYWNALKSKIRKN